MVMCLHQLSPVSTTRVDGPSTRLVETRARVDGQWKPVTRQLGPLTRAVNLDSGNRALGSEFSCVSGQIP